MTRTPSSVTSEKVINVHFFTGLSRANFIMSGWKGSVPEPCIVVVFLPIDGTLSWLLLLLILVVPVRHLRTHQYWIHLNLLDCCCRWQLFGTGWCEVWCLQKCEVWRYGTIRWNQKGWAQEVQGVCFGELDEWTTLIKMKKKDRFFTWKPPGSHRSNGV